MENIKDNNIFLIGMMGSWKSTVGKKLSERLKIRFVDIDDEIEAITGMKIHEIFDSYGEKRFREMESAYFIEKSKQTGFIFSTGGGIILSKDNRTVLDKSNMTYFLDASVQTLSNRIKNIKSRPLLKNKNKKETITSIYQSRIEYYRKCSNYIIDTNDLHPESVVEKIIFHLQNNENN